MEKLVSVILPTYGTPVFLNRTIQSVINQTYANWELIVVDDNTPDTETRTATEKIMAYYEADNRVLYLKHEKNKNGAVARNTGIEQARGDYICFIDSDDEYLPERLEKCVAALSSIFDSKFAGVYTGCEIKQNGVTIRRRTEIHSGNFIVETLAAGFPLSSGSNLFIRADVVKELRGFDVTFRRHQDYEFLVRYFRKYSLIAIQEILLVKNEIGTNRQDVDSFYKTKIQYLNKYKEDFDKLLNREKAYVYAEHYLVLQSTAFNQKDYKHFARFSVKSLKKRPVYTLIRTVKLFVRTILKRSRRVKFE